MLAVRSVTSVVSDSAPPWTVTRQAPLPMGFSSQEQWSGSPCPPPAKRPYSFHDTTLPHFVPPYHTVDVPTNPGILGTQVTFQDSVSPADICQLSKCPVGRLKAIIRVKHESQCLAHSRGWRVTNKSSGCHGITLAVVSCNPLIAT